MLSIYPNRAPLAPTAFSPLPLGSVLPEGWLLRQLRLQAGGLTGHLDEFWADVGPDSAWLGGAGEGWERGPYYLDGLVPLAHLLDDERLLGKARTWVDAVLARQQDDGWLGPVHDERTGHRRYDAWPVMVLLKALAQHQEATGDERVVPALARLFAFLSRNLDQYPLYSWGHFRWGDLLVSLLWLHNRTGDAALLDLAHRVRDQGYDWAAHFTAFPYRERTTGEYLLPTHVVNNAMGVKTPGLWFQLSYDPADLEASQAAIANLDRYHGQVTGIFSGDEHLAGRDPSQGTELCAVVEYLYSIEHLIAVSGDHALSDRLERIAYNALPATFSPDMWAHQYDQQVNQVLCSVAERQWTNNGPEANIFGLAPNFGCCTANMHQGWPKLAAHLWMATPRNGLAAVAYAPCRVTATLESGETVVIREETEYPFGEQVLLHIESAPATPLPLTLRVPGWCSDATLTLPGGETRPLPPGYHTVERTWRPGESLALSLPMAVRAERRYRGAVALVRGPLVFALKVGEEWRQVGGEPPHADWEVHPTTPWNYGLALDPSDPERSLRLRRRPLGERPFSPEGAPLELRAPGRRVPQWQMHLNSAGPLPESPAATDEPVEELTLIPYGSTNLRVTEMPLVPPER